MEDTIGIDLNKPITFLTASLRFFDKGEYHITRNCDCDVLLLMLDGVLRFTENGKNCEVKAGEYFIQRKDGYQSAKFPSDEPKYLYIHFYANWNDNGHILQKRGTFNIPNFSMIIKKFENTPYADMTYTEKSALLFTILSMLHSDNKEHTLADDIADFISENMATLSGLDEICNRFCYSKNHIINLFKAKYGMTPITYLGVLRIKKAMYLAEVTSASFNVISEEVGFTNYPYFYRLFVRNVGMSPERWRKILRVKGYVLTDHNTVNLCVPVHRTHR